MVVDDVVSVLVVVDDCLGAAVVSVVIANDDAI